MSIQHEEWAECPYCKRQNKIEITVDDSTSRLIELYTCDTCARPYVVAWRNKLYIHMRRVEGFYKPVKKKGTR